MKPKLFSVMKTYTKEQFVKDVVAGIIVAIIALPLSIALALASGVTPEKGIYTAIVAGFVISFLGGSRVQIAGPTAAFATIVAGIVARAGMDGLIIATIMAGIILILMGLFHFGSLIKFIPYTITTGFTAGIAVTIFIGQIKDFLGLTIVTEEPLIDTMDKLSADFRFISTINWWALGVGALCMVILIAWPYLPEFLNKIPASLIAVLVSSALVALMNLPVNTIGDLYTISAKLPAFSLPHADLKTIESLVPDAFTIAILAGIESLLSCVVADSMVNSRHRSNMELVAQGAGNIASALFGGIPATGAIARTAAKSDILVLVLTFALTVVFDLVVAIEVGLILTCILFMKRMSDVTEVSGWKYVEPEDDPEGTMMNVPKNTVVYEITGPMFFGAADKLLKIAVQDNAKCLILRMRSVNAIDSTAMRNFERLYKECQKKKVTLIFSHVNSQPMSIMHKAGFYEEVGADNFCAHINDAMKRAQDLQ